jgi:hypothetical protein
MSWKQAWCPQKHDVLSLSSRTAAPVFNQNRRHPQIGACGPPLKSRYPHAPLGSSVDRSWAIPPFPSPLLPPLPPIDTRRMDCPKLAAMGEP